MISVQKIKLLPELPGVYIFRDEAGKPLYVGKAVNLKVRVSSYFQKDLTLGPKTAMMVSKIGKIEHIVTETELEALLLEAELIKRLKPTYNIQLTDDKGYRYIEIRNSTFDQAQVAPSFDRGAKFEIRNKFKIQNVRRSRRFLRQRRTNSKLHWPTVTTSRRTDSPSSLYFGPFPEGKTVTQVLRTLRKIFPWCKYSSPPKDKKPCFYYHLGLCPGICIGKITLVQYRQNIRNLIRFLKGRKKDLIGDLEKQMKKAASQKDFEQAALLRDQILKLRYVTQKFRQPSAFIENPNLIEDQRRGELGDLIELIQVHLSTSPPSPLDFARGFGGAFGLPPSTLHPPVYGFRIESYDISNLQGKAAVGALVVFTGGLPDRQQYRRFKIKLKTTPDDLAMLAEVLNRRLKHLEWKKPDLILIDGGLTQVRSATKVLQEHNLSIPTVALAKKLEELWFASGRRLTIPKDSPALKLLQRIRDETHSFAIIYHRRLRQQSFIDRI